MITRQDLAAMTKELKKRLHLRELKSGRKYWYVDLRGARWADLGQVTVRDPEGEGWPDAGSSTDLRSVAERWIEKEHAYARMVMVAHGEGEVQLVRDAADAYIAELESRVGSVSPNTLKGRRSACKVHIVPALGDKPIGALTDTVVQRWVDGLEKQGGGELADKTVVNLHQSLVAVYKHAVGAAPDWKKVDLPEKPGYARLRAAQESGQILTDTTGRLETRDEIRDLLAVSMLWDKDLIEAVSHVRTWVAQQMPETVAYFIAHGPRLTAGLSTRHSMVRPGMMGCYIPGTKTKQGPRWVPMQRSYVPWHERLMAKHRKWDGEIPDPSSHYHRPDVRDPTKGMGKTTFQHRLGDCYRVLQLMDRRGLAHPLRRTYLTMLQLAGVPKEWRKYYAGHAVASEAMKEYVQLAIHDVEVFLKVVMPDEHRDAIDLPAPDEVEQRADELAGTFSWPVYQVRTADDDVVWEGRTGHSGRQHLAKAGKGGRLVRTWTDISGQKHDIEQE